MIPQNYHSDVTRWGHCYAAVWSCCEITRWDHCDIMDILFCIIYSYVSVIPQNYHSDVTRWRHCDAAVWSRRGITLWDHCDIMDILFLHYFIHMFLWNHRTIIVMSQGEVTVMLLCGYAVGSHCEITVTSLWHHGHIFFCIIYSYVSVISQNYHSDVTRWGHCDAAVWSCCGITLWSLWSLWHHGHIILHYLFICFSDITEHLSDVTKWGHCDAAEWVLQD